MATPMGPEPRHPADILVTGASGFIGRHLVGRLLTLGLPLRVLVRRSPEDPRLRDPRVDLVQGDLSDPAAIARAVEGVRLVYHLGAAMRGTPEEFERGTVAGTHNVVSAVSASPATRLVYVSSLSVLHAASARVDAVVREDWPLEPRPELRGVYTSTKLRAEALVRDAVRGKGLKAVIVRPGQVFGPGAELMTPAVARKAAGRLVIIGDGRLVLPLIYVEDLVDALLAAADHDVFDGSVFHIVDHEAVTQNELAQRYTATSSTRLRVTHVPAVAIRAVGFLAQLAATVLGRTAPLSPYRISSALAPMRYDCQAARSRLQWKPRVGTRNGLNIVFGSLPEAADASKGSHL